MTEVLRAARGHLSLRRGARLSVRVGRSAVPRACELTQAGLLVDVMCFLPVNKLFG